jgi:hypothetical protein
MKTLLSSLFSSSSEQEVCPDADDQNARDLLGDGMGSAQALRFEQSLRRAHGSSGDQNEPGMAEGVNEEEKPSEDGVPLARDIRQEHGQDRDGARRRDDAEEKPQEEGPEPPLFPDIEHPGEAQVEGERPEKLKPHDQADGGHEVFPEPTSPNIRPNNPEMRPSTVNVMARPRTKNREKTSDRLTVVVSLLPTTTPISSGIMARTQGLRAVVMPPKKTATIASQGLCWRSWEMSPKRPVMFLLPTSWRPA